MKKLVDNIVQETTVTSGTGALTLVASASWVRFSQAYAVNDLAYYSIQDGNNRELGLGTVGAGNTLARTLILETLVAGTLTGGGSAMTLSGQPAIVRNVLTADLLASLVRETPFIVSSSGPMSDGGCYFVTANNVVLSAVASPVAGARHRIARASLSVLSGVQIDPGAELIEGAAGLMDVDVANFDFTLIYVNGTYGWRVA